MIGLRGQMLQGLLCFACSLFLFGVAVADQDSGSAAAVAQGQKKDPTAAAQVKKKQSPAASQDSAPTKTESSGRFSGSKPPEKAKQSASQSSTPASTSTAGQGQQAPTGSSSVAARPIPPVPTAPPPPPPPPASARPSFSSSSTSSSSGSMADQLKAGKDNLRQAPTQQSSYQASQSAQRPSSSSPTSGSSSGSSTGASLNQSVKQSGQAAGNNVTQAASAARANASSAISTTTLSLASAAQSTVANTRTTATSALNKVTATSQSLYQNAQTKVSQVAQRAKNTVTTALPVAAQKASWGSKFATGLQSLGSGLTNTLAIAGSNPMFQQLSAMAVGGLMGKMGANKDMVDLAMATTMSATGTAALGGGLKDFAKTMSAAPIVQQTLSKTVANVAAKIDPRLEQMAFNMTLKGVDSFSRSTDVDDGKTWKESLKDFVVEKGVSFASDFVAKQFPNNPEFAAITGDLIKVAATGDKGLLLATAKQAAIEQGMKLMMNKLGGKFGGDNSQDVLLLMGAASEGQEAFKIQLVRMAQEKGKDNVLKLVASMQMGPEAVQIASIFIDAGMQGKDALITAGQEVAMAKGQDMLMKTIGNSFGGAEAVQLVNAVTAGPDAVKDLIQQMGIDKVMMLAHQVGGDELAQMIAVLAEASGTENLSAELQHIAMAKANMLATEAIGMDVAVLAQAVKSNDPEICKLEASKLALKYGADFTKRAMTDLGADKMLAQVNNVIDQAEAFEQAVEKKEAELAQTVNQAVAAADNTSTQITATVDTGAQKAQAAAEQKAADAKRAAQERLDAAKLKADQAKQAAEKRAADAKKLAEQKAAEAKRLAQEKADEELRKLEEATKQAEAEALALEAQAADDQVAQAQIVVDQAADPVVEDNPAVAPVAKPQPSRPSGIGSSIIAGKLNPNKVVASLNKQESKVVPVVAAQDDAADDVAVDISVVNQSAGTSLTADKKAADKAAVDKKAAQEKAARDAAQAQADKAALEKQAADDAAAKAAALVREKRLKAIAANLATFLREYSSKAAEQLKATAFNDQILDLTIPVILDTVTNDTVDVGMVYDLGFGGFGNVLEQPFAMVTGNLQPVMLQIDDEQVAIDQAFLQQYLPAPAYKLLDQIQQLTPQQVFLIKAIQLCNDAQNLVDDEQQPFMTAGLTLLFSRLTSTVDAVVSDDNNIKYISSVTDLFKDLPPFLQAAVKGMTMPVSEAQKIFFEDHQSAEPSSVAQLVGRICLAEGYNVRTGMLGNDLVKLIKPTLCASDKAFILTEVYRHITDYNKGFVADDSDDFISSTINGRLALLKPTLTKAVAAMKKAGFAAVDNETMMEISGFLDGIDDLINAEFIDDLPNYPLPQAVVAGKRDAMTQETLARYLQIMFVYVMRNVVERVFNSHDGAPYMDNALDKTSSFEELLALFVRGIRDRDYPEADVSGLINDELPSWYSRSSLDRAGYDALYKKIDSLTGALKLPSDLFAPVMRDIDTLAEEADGEREDALWDQTDNAVAAAGA